MAGSSSNWYKVSSGPLKGQSVYLSKAQRGSASRAQTLLRLNNNAPSIVAKANQQRPAAAAKTKAIQGASGPLRSFDSPDAADAYLREHHQAWGSTLTKSEQTGLDYYQSSGYYDINRSLRTGGYLNPKDVETKDAIDQAIAKAPPLADGIVTFRGMGLSDIKAQKFIDSLDVGGEYRDPAFLSTTLSRAYAVEAFASNIGANAIIEFRLPKGQKAAYMQARDPRNDGFDVEKEVLLPRDTRYRVVEKTPDGNNVRIVLEVF